MLRIRLDNPPPSLRIREDDAVGNKKPITDL